MTPIEFGENVFDISEENSYIPRSIFTEFNKQKQSGRIDNQLADEIAILVQKWATDRGASYFTHWFVPYNSKSAEKHNAILISKGSTKTIYGLTGESLYQSELDASSFPSGGIRSVFEARGFARWDLNSPMFIRESTLYIPTGFMSSNGDVLDERTPLLRSMQLLDKAACKLVHSLNLEGIHSVKPMLGIEQEFFVIEKDVYKERIDLIHCGRTLYGAPPSKVIYGESAYCSRIPKRVKQLLEEAHRELFRLGIPVETMHNEASPCQYEIAVRYVPANLACDYNQLVCSVLTEIAERLQLVCLFHEKPFFQLNGSGKHNNWSLITNTGENLISLSTNQDSNMLHLFFIAALIEAICKNQSTILGSAASYSNDFRLGGHEAPPKRISIYLGEQLERALFDNERLEDTLFEISYYIQNLNADRNRTAPIAYDGNKFEFRFPGAGQSTRQLNTILNVSVAESLFHFLDIIQQEKNVKCALEAIIREIKEKYAGILYSGNCYSQQWGIDAEKRGLFHMENALVGIETITSPSESNLMIQYGIYRHSELVALKKIKENECMKAVLMEANTLLLIIKDMLIRSALKYLSEIRNYYEAATNNPKLKSRIKAKVSEVEAVVLEIYSAADTLEESCIAPLDYQRLQERVVYAQVVCNKLESAIPTEYANAPRYEDILRCE